jgi:Holliday junction resolvase RusA-like endonuclease
MTQTIRIPGEPVGKARPRVTSGGHAYTPARTRAWESAAALLMMRGLAPLPAGVPLRLEVVAHHPAPLRKAPPAGSPCMGGGRRPDLDNVIKAAADALQIAGVVPDDRQIVAVVARSVYGPPGEGWVDVTIEEVTP